jgi:hypothetical protein
VASKVEILIKAKDQASPEFAKVSKSAQSMSTSLQAFGQSMMKVGAGITAGVTLPVVAAFKGMYDAAAESAKIGKVTEQIIQDTGGAAKLSAGQIGDLANALSLKTGVDDEVIQSGQNVLLTFKAVRDEVGAGNQIFSRASEAALDMATVFGTDVSAASMQLGKALNDPIAGITALSRAGVTFTEQQQEQIKTMVAAGDTLSAQKLILAEVEGQLGGAAAAAATNADRAKVAFGNMAEQLGAILIPFVEKAAGFVSDLAAKFGELSPRMQTMILVGLALAAAIGPLITIIGGLVTVFGFLLSPIGLVVAAMAAMAAGLVYLYRNNEDFRRAVDDA